MNADRAEGAVPLVGTGTTLLKQPLHSQQARPLIKAESDIASRQTELRRLIRPVVRRFIHLRIGYSGVKPPTKKSHEEMLGTVSTANASPPTKRATNPRAGKAASKSHLWLNVYF
jgi:hypothetical protein